MNEKINPFMVPVPEGGSKATAQTKAPIVMPVPEGGSKAIAQTKAPKLQEGLEAGHKAEVKQVNFNASVPTGGNKPQSEAIVPEAVQLPAENASMQHIGGWKGMNKRATFDSGALSEAVNVTFRDFPNVESSVMPCVVNHFEMVEKLVQEDGTITSVTKPLGKVYDAITRGDELFIAAEEGYVYAKMIDGKLCYITMCEDIVDNPDTIRLLPTEITRSVFVEDYDDEAMVVTIDKNVCVFSTWDIAHGSDKKKWLPVFPSGSIEFVKEAFLPLVWSDKADTSLIYCVCNDDGKAVEVWRYFTGVAKNNNSTSTFDCWVELRRNLYVRMNDDGDELHMGYYPDDHDDMVSSTEWKTASDEEHVGICVGKVTSTALWISVQTAETTGIKQASSLDVDSSLKEFIDAESFLAGIDLDILLNAIDVRQTRDNICGICHFWLGYGVFTPGDDSSYCYKPGIFNYEATVAPEFEHVTFYKGRVFGSTGSTVIASMHNSYNKWELDTTEDISSDNAWMTTTTANANADGDIVAMREYLGRISVFKSGFMQEVYGGSNPFTIQDVYAVGTPFPEAVCEAYGRLCFCGKNAIRVYGGGFPKVLGDELGIDTYEDVQMLGDDRSVIVRSGGKVYKYDFLLGMWEERSSDYFNDVGKMIVLSGEMYTVTNSGELVKLEGTGYGAWSFATDAMTESTLSLKRLQKVRLTYELGAESEFSMLVVKSDGNELETVTRQNKEEKTVLQRCEFSLTNAVDWFLKLRFTGSGYFKLISLDVEIKNGSTTMYE